MSEIKQVATLRGIEWAGAPALPLELVCEALESDLWMQCERYDVEPVGHRQFELVHADADSYWYDPLIAVRIECDVKPTEAVMDAKS